MLKLRESEMNAWPSTRRRRKERSSQLLSLLSQWMLSLGVCLSPIYDQMNQTDLQLDDETDMKALEAAVRGIVKDGLVWGASKLVPVGFGIKKLQINLIIEDDKISLSELEEEIAEIEEYVQSTDIVSLSLHASIEKSADRLSGRYAKAIEFDYTFRSCPLTYFSSIVDFDVHALCC